ncbi:MAG: carboxymuconolactone decarboxylase family protein [Armatimonadetes bacterium]|nr:carboxymuconolactone decarboxylase family protein [Armatimonadota bacterium]
MPKLPSHFKKFMTEQPAVGAAYGKLSDAVAEAGPLDAKTRALVKLGLSLGAKMEGAVHSQARKALEAGATREEIRHAVLQATTTLGFPQMMTGIAWVEDVFRKEDERG